MVETVKELIRLIIDADNAYGGTGMMLCLYFISMLIIAFYCKDEIIKKIIILPSVFLLIIVYVGVPLLKALGFCLDYYDGRLFWMLMTPVVTAIALTLFISGINNQKSRIIALILIIPISLYCGQYMISKSMYLKAENAYRLPQEAVDITEKVLSQTDNPKLIVPYTFAHPFRQISTDVYLLYGEDATYGRITPAKDEFCKICDEMGKTIPDLNYIMPIANENGVDYILFDTTYTELCENGNINIFGIKADENYVGDRTPYITFDNLADVSVINDENGVYWDLSSYGLSYDGTFGQYILYRFN